MSSFDSVALGQRVLELGASAQWLEILSLVGDKVTADTPFPQLRKAYLKLSLVVHPDKLAKQFPEAKKAFQFVVQAFESITKPEVVADGPSQPKHKAFARSNDGCMRTVVKCPRCKVPWGTAIDGNPEYFYNFLMTGLKSYSCSTCLLKFGCMSATHECPYCRGKIDYHPDDYHRKVDCPHCCRDFGFFMFPCSDMALRTAKEEVRREVEDQRKKDAASARRLASARRRGGGMDAELEKKAFAMGLTDQCPLCGEDFTCMADVAAQVAHLRDCTDSNKHAAHKQKKDAAQQRVQTQKEVTAEQQRLQQSAAWALVGGGLANLWMLSDQDLRQQCSQNGLPRKGSRLDLLRRLVTRRLENGEQESPNPLETMPHDLGGLTADQLKEVLICHRIDPATNKLRSRKALLATAENVKLHDALELPKQKLALLGDTNPKKRALADTGDRSDTDRPTAAAAAADYPTLELPTSDPAATAAAAAAAADPVSPELPISSPPAAAATAVALGPSSSRELPGDDSASAPGATTADAHTPEQPADNHAAVTAPDTQTAVAQTPQVPIVAAAGSGQGQRYMIRESTFLGAPARILMQGENGPCPLLAVCNVLSLRRTLELPRGASSISFEDLISLVANLIVDQNAKLASERGSAAFSLDDLPPSPTRGLVVSNKALRALTIQQSIDEVIGILPKLHRGLDVNVCFRDATAFEFTPELSVFDILDVGLFHGWVASPDSPETYSVLSELTYNLAVEKSIVYEEKRSAIERCEADPSAFSEAELREGHIAADWLLSHPAQFTYDGLAQLHSAIKENELCVLFRNNHFSTVFRRGTELFVLATDEGFCESTHAMWEKLAQLDGDTLYTDALFAEIRAAPPSPGFSPDEQLARQLQREEEALMERDMLLQQQRQQQGQQQGQGQRVTSAANQTSVPPTHGQAPSNPPQTRPPRPSKKRSCTVM